MDIDLREYEHLEDISKYNHNYYKHKKCNTGVILLDVFDEQFQTHEISLIDDKGYLIFLGTCPWTDGISLKNINIGEQYT
jgi:hypothetical protein